MPSKSKQDNDHDASSVNSTEVPPSRYLKPSAPQVKRAPPKIQPIGKNDLDRFGQFSDMGYLNTQHKYKPPPKGSDLFLSYRAKGKQLVSNPPKKGKVPEAFFEKSFAHIFAAEAYCDQVKLNRQYRLAKREFNVTDQPFKSACAAQKPCGSGSFYGTISYQFPLPGERGKSPPPSRRRRGEEDEESAAERRRATFASDAPHAPVHLQHEKRNFYTRPPKQGTGYGYVDVAIGSPYPYKSSPYDAAHKQELSERALNKKLMASPQAFISATRPVEFFDPQVYRLTARTNQVNDFIHLVANGKPITLDQLPDKPEPPKEIMDEENSSHLPPFRPAGGPKSGIYGTINKYPQAEPLPLPPPTLLNATGVDGEKSESQVKGLNFDYPIFRPTGRGKSFPIKSIMSMQIPLAPPQWVQQTAQRTAITSNN